ncbi:MAG: dTMP kinase [Clostridia bacterium]
MKGLITFEGCEGVGKTTQVQLFKEYCEKNGIDAVFTREPGGSVIAEEIRKIVLNSKHDNMSNECEALLYAAARNQHINDIIIPALERGKMVFCDRYFDSTYAYQGFARGLGEKFVEKLNELSVGSYTPEYTVFLDLDPETAFKRKGGADKKDRLEIENISFYNKVYDGYRTIIEKEPKRFIIVDASGTMEQTSEVVVKVLRNKGIIK